MLRLACDGLFTANFDWLKHSGSFPGAKACVAPKIDNIITLFILYTRHFLPNNYPLNASKKKET
jgi:hypothetical protein